MMRMDEEKSPSTLFFCLSLSLSLSPSLARALSLRSLALPFASESPLISVPPCLCERPPQPTFAR